MENAIIQGRAISIGDLKTASINQLDKLENEMMIGEGIRKMKMNGLKQMIKQHNKRQKKPEAKIKGYGKMKKAEMREIANKIYTY